MQSSVRLILVSGKLAVPGNERADELARKGSETEFIGSEPAVCSYECVLTDLIRQEAKIQPQISRLGWQTCTQAREFFRGETRKPPETS